MIMRTNDIQKIKVLENILQQIVDNSNTIYYYDIETLSTDGNLLVNTVLSNEDGVVIREFEGTYFEVLCDVKLVLYGLLD